MAAALLGMSTTAMAQATYLEANGDTTVFKKHVFMQLQGGAQYTLGEAKFGDLISPNVQFGLGYQFNPWFGARVAVNAWQSKGGFNGKISDGTNGNIVYKYKYVAPTVDFMFNLSQAFCGYNPHRVFNVTAFIGAGANIAFSNDEAQNVAASGYKMQYLWDGTKVRPVGRLVWHLTSVFLTPFRSASRLTPTSSPISTTQRRQATATGTSTVSPV